MEKEGAAAPLPDRAQPQTGGQELLVRDVREEDAGVYSCWANNSASASSTSTTFNVIVQCTCLLTEGGRAEEGGRGKLRALVYDILP